MAVNGKATLVRGVLIFHEGVHYSNANLTDEVARAFLVKFPQRKDWFEVLPEKEKKEPEKEPAKEVKKKAKKSEK